MRGEEGGEKERARKGEKRERERGREVEEVSVCHEGRGEGSGVAQTR
jgi:hypothetical protein